MSCLIVFKSITHGQYAVNILSKIGISAELIRCPLVLAKNSCSYAVLINKNQLQAALSRIQKFNITIVSVNVKDGAGNWREIKV